MGPPPVAVDYTREELRKKLQNGVPIVNKENEKGPTPPLYMPAWKDRISRPEMDALMDYLFSIAEKQAAVVVGDPWVPRQWPWGMTMRMTNCSGLRLRFSDRI